MDTAMITVAPPCVGKQAIAQHVADSNGIDA
jgi:hypothetical protein